MELEKYKHIADKYGIEHMLLISPQDIVFDIRSILKCNWGCDKSKGKTIKCDNQGLSIEERKQIINAYSKILLLHGHDGYNVTKACLHIEKELFLDNYYYAFTLRACNFCKDCRVDEGKDCIHPDKVRPCEEMFGIDVYQTARNLELPIKVLKNEDEVQNRYGFVLVV
jgi:predicted metal-binding protein